MNMIKDFMMAAFLMGILMGMFYMAYRMTDKDNWKAGQSDWKLCNEDTEDDVDSEDEDDLTDDNDNKE